MNRRRFPQQTETLAPSQLLEAVFDQSQVATVVISNPDLVLRYINRAAVDALGICDEPTLVGLPIAEVRRGQTWCDLTRDGSPASPEFNLLGRALRGELSGNQEFSLLRKDGSRRWFLGGGCPICRPDGQVMAAALTFRDVTESRAAVEQLRELAREQRTILETVSAGICLLRSDRIEWVNPAFEAMFGCAAEEVKGQDTSCFYANAEDYQRVHMERFPRLNPGNVYSTEILLKRKSGALFWCQISERSAQPIHLLFTDVVLPGMNGRELAERLRLIHPETVVLFASGYNEDAILRTGVMSDQFHFISKPYSLQSIALKVREVLDARLRLRGEGQAG